MSERDINPNSPSAMAAQKTPEEIQEDVRRARSVIKEDIRELGERFKPEHLKQNAIDAIQNAKEQAFDAMSERGRRMAGAAKSAAKSAVSENGAPLLLIGLGAGWLLMSQARKRRAQQPWYEPGSMAFESGGYRTHYPAGGYQSYQGTGYQGTGYQGAGYQPSTGASYQGAGYQPSTGAAYTGAAYAKDSDYAAERAGYEPETYPSGYAGEAIPSEGSQREGWVERSSHAIQSRTERFRDELGRFRGQVQDRGHQMMDVSRERVLRARDRTRDFAVENPFVFGAAVLAAGIGVGMLLPETRRENRVLGPTRDRLLGQARGIAKDVRSTASQIGEEVRSTAREIGQSTKSAASEIRETITERNAPH